MKKDYFGIDFILLFAYGEGLGVNIQLAKIADDIALEQGIHIFTQKDMVNLCRFKTSKVIIAPQKGLYISSLQIIDAFWDRILKDYYRLHGIYPKTLIVAAPQHIKRCIGDFKKVCRGYLVRGFDEYPQSGQWYNPTDPQPWVRSPFVWWRSEIPIRIIRFFWYSLYARKVREIKKR